MPRLVIAPDSFGPRAGARQVAAAMAAGAEAAGWDYEEIPVSDGGEGFCAVFGGRLRTARVHDPLGRAVDVEWRLLDGGRTAVVETALASGLALVGGPEGNDPIRADTAGTGEVIAEAVKAGARRVLVGMGGSASTDGGLAALDVLEPHSRLRGVELVAACDTSIHFVDAARVFAAQKGASATQVELLNRRLERLAQVYERNEQIDVRPLPGGGAAGGLAGGLAALGGILLPGFDVVADALELAERIEGADLVMTGEAYLDDESYTGKSVGGVADLAAQSGVPAVVVAIDGPSDRPAFTLVERFGADRVETDPLGCIEEIVGALLRSRGTGD